MHDLAPHFLHIAPARVPGGLGPGEVLEFCLGGPSTPRSAGTLGLLLRWTVPYLHLQDDPEVFLPTQEQSRYPIVFCWGPWEPATHLGQDPNTAAKVSRRLKEGAVISCLLSEKSHSSMKLQFYFFSSYGCPASRTMSPDTLAKLQFSREHLRARGQVRLSFGLENPPSYINWELMPFVSDSFQIVH